MAFPLALRADMEILQLNSARHDRFYTGTNKAFIGAAWNWSGVGRANNGAWATMISPRYFVSATHYHPTGGNTLTFYEGNSNTPSHTYTVDNWGYQTTNGPDGSDLWLGRLTAPLDPAHHIATYPVLVLKSDAWYRGLEIYCYGVPHRVGRNTIDEIHDYTAEGGNTRLLKFDYTVTNSPVNGDECHLIGGDSGAPTFVACGSELALIGTHYTTSDTSPYPTNPMWSGDAFVPFYVDQLNAHMAGGEQVRTCGLPTRPQLLAYEPFDYPVGPLGGGDGGLGWTNAWTASAYADVVQLASPLVYRRGDVGVYGGSRSMRWKGSGADWTLPTVTRGLTNQTRDVYLSFLAAHTNGTPTFLSTVFFGRVDEIGAHDHQTGPGFGLSGSTNLGFAAFFDGWGPLGSNAPAINTAYFIAAKLTWDATTNAFVCCDVWINPDSAERESGIHGYADRNAPNWQGLYAASNGLNYLCLAALNLGADIHMLMDELRVGTTWSDVVPYEGLIAYDGFSYTPGPIGGRNGGVGWTNAWSSNVYADVVSVAQPLAYVGGNIRVTGGTRALRFNGTTGFTAAAIQRGIPILRTHTNLYLSCLVAYTNGIPVGSGWRTAFIGRNYPSAPNPDRQTGVGFGTYGGGNALGWVAHADIPVQLGTVKPVTNQAYLMVLKLTWSPATDALVQAEGWINPTDRDAEAGPALAHALGSPQTPFTEDAGGLRAIWMGNFDNDANDTNKVQFLMDEIRVGTSWRSVFPGSEVQEGTLLIIRGGP